MKLKNLSHAEEIEFYDLAEGRYFMYSLNLYVKLGVLRGGDGVLVNAVKLDNGSFAKFDKAGVLPVEIVEVSYRPK